MLYAIKNQKSGYYYNSHDSEWFETSLKGAKIWKTESRAEKAVSEIESHALNRYKKDISSDLEISIISEEEYQKAIQGKFAVGQKVIYADFDPSIKTLEPSKLEEVEITRETVTMLFTSNGKSWKKDKLDKVHFSGEFLLSNQSEIQKIIGMRYRELILRRVKGVDASNQNFWHKLEQLLASEGV